MKLPVDPKEETLFHQEDGQLTLGSFNIIRVNSYLLIEVLSPNIINDHDLLG